MAHAAGLDSPPFYRFLSAWGGGGPIAVYVDGQSAYTHEITQQGPYAMMADSGRPTLRLRLPDRLVTLRDGYLRLLHELTLVEIQ